MKTIMPYQTIGIIGGGQLARMMCIAAKAMGYFTAVLDPTENCPAAQVSDIEITAEYNDLAAIKKLAEVSDVITYEFEKIDVAALEWLEKNAYLPQGSEALKISRHRYLEKSTIADMGIPVADFVLIKNSDELAERVTYPSVLKTTTGGYDGKGQIVLRSEADLPRACELADSAECILEKFVDYSKEVSVCVARSVSGEVAAFPVSENLHVNNILHQSIVPARVSAEVESAAISCAKKIVENLNWVGIMGVEMFVVDGEIVINEIAPRPHNSGHYTIDACVTSQFEQHIRAVCGLPLAATTLHSPVVMVNILGDHIRGAHTQCRQHVSDAAHSLEAGHDLPNLAPYLPLLPHGKIHLYGKADAVEKRKMGHFNLLGDIEESLALIKDSKIWEESAGA